MKYEQINNNNKVMLTGEIKTKPVFSHETFGEGFYEFILEVPRLSEKTDLIPVIISEKLLNDPRFFIGNTVCIKGQFRSYNKAEEERSRLILNVFAREIVDVNKEVNPNIIEITGFICKEPIYRITPFKREICDILVAVNRAYNKSDYLPCIAWGRNARYIKNISVGTKIFLVGRIQSREYQKKTENGEILTKTAYEISISRIQIDNQNLSEIESEEDGNVAINL